MLAKVFNKGQVVIPVKLRRKFEIVPGDYVEITIDEERGCIELKKPEALKSEKIAGSLSRYGQKKTFPTKKQMGNVFRNGMSREG